MWTRIHGARCVLACALSLALGCSGGGALDPARSANEVAPGQALTHVGPVLVTAEGNWQGDGEVTEQVTPVRITIHNGGSRAVDLRYSHVVLVGAQGQEFKPLQLTEIGGSIETTVGQLVSRSDQRGRAEPHFGMLYEGVEVRPPAELRHLEYYDHLYDNFVAEVPLPTPYMRKTILPEARVGAQAVLSGHVYFEHVPPESVDLVTLKLTLLDPDTGRSVGTASIPFTVD